MKPAFKIGKAKKITLDEKTYLVVVLKGKVPSKVVRELKIRLNAAVQDVLNPAEVSE